MSAAPRSGATAPPVGSEDDGLPSAGYCLSLLLKAAVFMQCYGHPEYEHFKTGKYAHDLREFESVIADGELGYVIERFKSLVTAGRIALPPAVLIELTGDWLVPGVPMPARSRVRLGELAGELKELTETILGKRRRGRPPMDKKAEETMIAMMESDEEYKWKEVIRESNQAAGKKYAPSTYMKHWKRHQSESPGGGK